MSVGDAYAIAVLRETTDRLISENKLTPLQAFTLRLFIDEAEKTREPKNYAWRTEIVGRALDAVEAML